MATKSVDVGLIYSVLKILMISYLSVRLCVSGVPYI